jgi:alpha-glucosidase (family GH31 glycosyl hydrolase)
MIAPVIRQSQSTVKLYLPKGEWGQWWTHEVVQGPAWILAPAPLGYPVAFYHMGSLGEEIAHQLGELHL